MSASQFTCPHCATSILLPADAKTRPQCPQCGCNFNVLVAKARTETLSFPTMVPALGPATLTEPEPPPEAPPEVPEEAPVDEIPEAVSVEDIVIAAPPASPPPSPPPPAKAPLAPAPVPRSVPVIVLPQPAAEPAAESAFVELADEEDEPTPKRRRRDRDEEDEDEEEQRPRRRESATRTPRRRADSGGKIAVLAVVGALALVGVVIGGYYAFRDPPREEVRHQPPITGGGVPPKKDDKKKDQPPLTREQMLKKVKASTVYIRTHLPGGSGSSGTGFFAGKPGYVVTNAHVVGYGPLRIQVPEKVEVVVDSGEPGERTITAKVFGLDAELDLAVLRVEMKDMPPPLPFGKAEELIETQQVVIFGYPFGESLGKNVSINDTTVSSLRRANGSVEKVQLAGGLNSGNSGGPVTNTKGEVIGVSVSKFRGTDTIGFAIPAEVTVRFVEDMHACNGQIRLGYLEKINELFKDPPGAEKATKDPKWAPLQIPAPKPVAVTPPTFAGDSAVVKLSSFATGACVGGGGRFVVFHLPDEKQLAVLDVSAAKVVKTVPAPAKALFASGMNTLFVVDPEDDTIERWNLTTFAKEGLLPLPIGPRMRVTTVAIGGASNGPLMVQAIGAPGQAERFLFDVVTGKEVKGSRADRGGFVVRPSDRLRASADGRTFTNSRADGHASVIAVTDTGYHEADLPWETAATGTLPGGDGQTVYAPGGIAGRAGVRAAPPADAGWTYLPAVRGPLYLAAPKPGAARQFVALHAARDRQPLAELPPIPALQAVLDRDKVSQIDRHAFFIPEAHALVVLSPDGDAITIHKFDVDALLEKAADYLFVTSAPPQAVVGNSFEYRLAVKSKKPAAGFKLVSGPPELAVSADGRVSWDVPEDFRKPAAVAVAITDAAGKEHRHEFELIPTLPAP